MAAHVRALLLPLVLLPSVLLASFAWGQDIQFPELTGRVVDQADMLDAATEREITALLEGHERATGNQLVVATLEDLQGYSIEEFGYRLGRHWGIGQQDKDNGALLLVGEAERKVRIEVGYGLEGELTDAISSSIIHSVILPSFKRGQFDQGIRRGVQAMVEAIGGEYQAPTRAKPTDTRTKAFILFLVFGGWLALASITSTGGRGGSGRRLLLLGGLGALGGGRGGGFGGGGGFSGGGGGFGGGGASGGW